MQSSGWFILSLSCSTIRETAWKTWQNACWTTDGASGSLFDDAFIGAYGHRARSVVQAIWFWAWMKGRFAITRLLSFEIECQDEPKTKLPCLCLISTNPHPHHYRVHNFPFHKMNLTSVVGSGESVILTMRPNLRGTDTNHLCVAPCVHVNLERSTNFSGFCSLWLCVTWI